MRTILRLHFIPVRMAKIKKTNDNKACHGCGKVGTVMHYWWEQPRNRSTI